MNYEKTTMKTYVSTIHCNSGNSHNFKSDELQMMDGSKRYTCTKCAGRKITCIFPEPPSDIHMQVLQGTWVELI